MSNLHAQNQNSIEKYAFMHHFVPHKEKKVRATVLRNNALFVYLITLILLILTVRLLPKVAPGILGYASNIDTQALLDETNTIRQQNGLPPLIYNKDLSIAAENKAADMFEYDYWAHVSPQGKKPWDFILAQEYDYIYAGENLAKNFNNSKDVVVAWNNSPSHKENLLSTNYDDVGFAIVNGVLDGYETTLVVQMFGRPKNPTYLAHNEDRSNQPLNQGVNDIDAEVKANVPLSDGVVDIALDKNINLNENLPQVNTVPVVTTSDTPAFIDVTKVSRYFLLIFVSFIITMLLVDVWYSHKKAIVKINGHAILHIIFLITVVASFWLLISPGSVI